MHTDSHHSEEDEQRLVEALTLAFETMKTSLNKALTLCDEIYESLVYYTLSDKKREYYTARTLLLRGSIHAEFRHYEKGLEDVEIAFNAFLALHDNEYCARSLLVKAIALTYNAQFSEALNILNEATFYAHHTTNAEIRAAIPLRMGFVHHTMGNHDKALEYYYQTLHGLDEKQYPLLAATCYNDIAASLTRIEHFSEAEEYYKKAITINKSNNNKRGLIRNLSDYGVLLTQRGQTEESLPYHLEALEYAEEFHLAHSKAVCYSNLAVAYYQMRDLAQSIDYLKKSLALHEHNNDNMGKGISYGNIAIAYSELQDYDDAFEFAQRGLHIAQEIGSKELQALNHNTLTIIHTRKKEYDKALEHSELCYQLYDAIGNRFSAGIALFNKAQALEALQQLKEALALYERCLTIIEQFHHPQFIAQCTAAIAFIMQKMDNQTQSHQHETAINEYIEKTEENIKKHNIATSEMMGTLAEIAEAQGKFDKALHYQKQCTELREKFISNEAARHLRTLKAEREIATKDKERIIAESEKELALRDAEIYRLEKIELAERNTRISEQNQQLLEQQEQIRAANKTLRQALLDLAELGASRLARTIVMASLFILFVLSEVLVDPIIETITNSAILGVFLRFGAGLLFRPLESYIEHLAIKKRKDRILSIVKE